MPTPCPARPLTGCSAELCTLHKQCGPIMISCTMTAETRAGAQRGSAIQHSGRIYTSVAWRGGAGRAFDIYSYSPLPCLCRNRMALGPARTIGFPAHPHSVARSNWPLSVIMVLPFQLECNHVDVASQLMILLSPHVVALCLVGAPAELLWGPK